MNQKAKKLLKIYAFIITPIFVFGLANFLIGQVYCYNCEKFAKGLDIKDLEHLKNDQKNVIVKFKDGSYSVLNYMPYELFFHPGFDFCFIKSSTGKLYKSHYHFCLTPFPNSANFDDKEKAYLFDNFESYFSSLQGKFKSFE